MAYTTHPRTRPIPDTDAESCARYGATANYCTCPDATNRAGGSYRDERGFNICKHKNFVRQSNRPAVARPVQPTAEPAPIVWSGTPRTSHDSCTCMDYQMQDRYGYQCEHIREYRTRALGLTSAPSAERRAAMTQQRMTRAAQDESQARTAAAINRIFSPAPVAKPAVEPALPAIEAPLPWERASFLELG
jgi:hypothetical protein